MNKKLGYQILELCGILLGNAILAFGIAGFCIAARHDHRRSDRSWTCYEQSIRGWISRWQ